MCSNDEVFVYSSVEDHVVMVDIIKIEEKFSPFHPYSHIKISSQVSIE
jgi:hypothetical protein